MAMRVDDLQYSLEESRGELEAALGRVRELEAAALRRSGDAPGTTGAANHDAAVTASAAEVDALQVIIFQS